MNNSIPQDIKPRTRKTKYMIEQENKRILDFILGGATHKQVREWIGISERQYWRRIKQIQLDDIQVLEQKQTRESRAFLIQRTIEKLQLFQQGALAMATSKTLKPMDRIGAYYLARQLAKDQLSLEVYGVSHLLTPQINERLYDGNRRTALLLRETLNPASTTEDQQQSDSGAEEDTEDSNRVF